jgi:transcriptional regulator with XRE-family HTH domain
MSTIVDDPVAHLALRIASERLSRAWSLAELAERSGVSKAMISKIERQEASPTATVLARIASAFEITLAALLTPQRDDEPRLVRGQDLPRWTDPASGYVRRQVFLSARSPLEIVEVDLPAGAAVAFPAASYVRVRQVLWVMDGEITVLEAGRPTRLRPGDRLEFGPPTDRIYRNDGAVACRYLMVLLRP